MVVRSHLALLEEVDLRSASFTRDPYPTYEILREHDPVHHSRELGMWLVTRHDLVLEVLTDGRRFGKRWPAGTEPAGEGDTGAGLPASMLETDPPDHTRLRRLVAPFFTPPAVARLAPRVEQIVDELLADLDGRTELDVVADFALPLPIRVVTDLLGLPAADHDRFRHWTEAYVRSFDVTQGPEVREAGARAHQALADYFEVVVRERRATPAADRPQDMLSDLVGAHEDRDVLTEPELVSMCILLLFAGYETTFSMIANGIRLLLRDEDARRIVLEQPDRRKAACDEIMRYESPVQRVGYITQVETELGGVALRPGDVVLAGLGAANRDPAVFADPERLDLTRNAAKHLALGRGIHYCIGGPLALLEGSIAIPAFLQRFPALELVSDEPAWAPTSAHRRLTHLPVRVQGGVAATGPHAEESGGGRSGEDGVAAEARTLLAPFASAPDPRDAYRALGAARLLAPSWPRELGGRGLGRVEDCQVLEALVAADVPDTLYVTTVQVVGDVLLRWGPEHLRTRLLPALAAGEAFASVLFSEPAAGSDLASISTSGVFEADGTVTIDGTKCWSVATPWATHALCAFRDAGSTAGRYRDLCLAVVPLSAPGVEIVALPTVQPETLHEIRLRGVVVPQENLVGGRGDAWTIISGSITSERTGFDYLGRARRWLDALAAVSGPDTVRSLEDRFRGAQALARRGAVLADARGAQDTDAAVVKLVCSELAQDVAQRASELVAVSTDTPDGPLRVLHHAWREAPGLTMSAGASEVLVDLAASALPDSALESW